MGNKVTKLKKAEYEKYKCRCFCNNKTALYTQYEHNVSLFEFENLITTYEHVQCNDDHVTQHKCSCVNGKYVLIYFNKYKVRKLYINQCLSETHECMCITDSKKCKTSNKHKCICNMVHFKYVDECISEKHECVCQKFSRHNCKSDKHLCSCKKFQPDNCMHDGLIYDGNGMTKHYCTCELHGSEHCKSTNIHPCTCDTYGPEFCRYDKVNHPKCGCLTDPAQCKMIANDKTKHICICHKNSLICRRSNHASKARKELPPSYVESTNR